MKINKNFFRKKTFIIIAAVLAALAIFIPLFFAYYINTPNFVSDDKNFISVSTDKAYPGDIINYSITITNEGRRAANDILITSEIPANTTLEDKDIKYFKENTSDKIYFFIESLEPGKNFTIEYPVKIDIPLDDGSIISNDVFEIEYRTKGADKISRKFQADLNTEIKSSVDFSGSYFRAIDENEGLLSEGDILDITLFIKNTGNMAPDGIAIENVIPEGTSYIDGTFRAKTAYMDEDGGKLVIKLDDVGLDKNIFINYSLLINSNIRELDFSPAILTGQERKIIEAEKTGNSNIELSEFKLAGTDEDGGALLANDTIKYEVSLKNGGGENFKYVAVENTIPPHTSLIETSLDESDIHWMIEDEVFRVDLLEFGPGEEFSFNYRVKVDSSINYGTKINNKAVFISNGDRLSTNSVIYNVVSDYSYDVIVLGDSQVRRTAWVEYVNAIFEENYFYGDFNFIKSGQDGETIDLGYNRMIESGLLRQNPYIFIINYGTNDAYTGSGYFRTSPEVFRYYLGEMIETIRQHTGALVVVMSTGPANPDVDKFHNNSNLALFNSIAAQAADEHNALFVDVFSPMVQTENFRQYLGDGLHYNSLGDELVAEILFKKISGQLNQYGLKD